MSEDKERGSSVLDRLTQRGRHELVLGRRELLILASIIVAALLVVRFWELDNKPGLEWDEPVYASVASNLLDYGTLEPKHSLGIDEPYLYHPPFYFYALAAWFNLTEPSVESARVLAVIGSMLTLAGMFVLLRRRPGGRAALVLLAVLALDGWLVFSNRIALIENLMFPVGVGGVVIYQWAVSSDRSRSQKFWGYLFAGLTLGTAAVLKHTLAYLLLVPLFRWIIEKTDTRDHARLVVGAGSVILLYVVGMSVVFGADFLEQYRVQLTRALGIATSRGSVGLGDLVQAAIGTYRPFVVTVSAAVLSALMVGYRLFTAIRARSLAVLRGADSLYLSWALAGLVSFALLGVRLPQYFMLVFIPLYVYAGTRIVTVLRTAGEGRARTTLAVGALLLMVIALNGVTFMSRIALQEDNAIRQASAFVAENYSEGDLVLADEPIGVLVPQPYLQTDLWAAGINQLPPDLIVTYTSLTQKLPTEVETALIRATPVFTATGFKETIVVYEAR